MRRSKDDRKQNKLAPLVQDIEEGKDEEAGSAEQQTIWGWCFLCTYESTTAGFTSFPARGNFCKESNYSSLAALSQKCSPASCGLQRSKEDKRIDMYQILNIEWTQFLVYTRMKKYRNEKQNNSWTFPTRKDSCILFSFHHQNFR